MSSRSDWLRQGPGDLPNRPVAVAPLVGGRVCLDFANTVAGWQGSGAPRDFEPLEDRLLDYADLLAWAQRRALVDEASIGTLWRDAHRRPRDAAAVVARARRLRHAVYRTARRLADRRVPVEGDVEAILGEFRVARRHERLQASETGLSWTRMADPRALDRELWPVAESAVELFTTANLARLRVCPGEECGWVFEDTSRNGSRRWCEMADCGNLAKVRRFRLRSRRSRRERRT